MPQYTELRIRQLCNDALAAQTKADVERLLPELRAALCEHIHLAAESLKSQVSTVAALDSKTFD